MINNVELSAGDISMEKPLMSLYELAKYIGLSHATLYRYVKRKKIPAIKIGKLWKFRKEKIDDWLKRQENAG